MRRAALAVVAACSLAGCTIVRGRLEPLPPPAPSGRIIAGAARVDITPPPGYPMGGHSLTGHVGEGYWTRLRARAVYVEDARGHGLAMVATDLWQIPEGLTDQVAVALAERGIPISREQILLAASHTHHSPAAFSTDRFFTTFAAARSGFDRRLFDFLATQIADAIGRAYAGTTDVRVSMSEGTADRVFRNRSYSAFLHDDEAPQIVRDNARLSACEHLSYAPDACRGIDPRISVLRFDRVADGTPVAIAVLLAAHATVIDHRSTLYSSDLFGFAATNLERRLRRADGEAPVVAFFNGAEGDVSFAWNLQDRANLLALAGRVVASVTSTLPSAKPLEPFAITYATTRITQASQTTLDGTGTVTTSRGAMPGAATACGAEDGPSGMPAWLSREGTRGTPRGPHGVKIGAIDFHCGARRLFPFSLTGSVVAMLFPPADEVPLGIYRLGPLALVGLPGEFTTVLGRRIRAAIADALPGSSPTAVRSIGLANGYGYYFTTPQEYDRQHYEGSGTMFGRAIGPVLIDRYARLASSMSDTPQPSRARSFRHNCGATNEFGLEWISSKPSPATSYGLQYVLRYAPGDSCVDPWPQFCWRDGRPELPTKALPHVAIEREVSRRRWEPLIVGSEPQDDEGERFVVRAGGRRSWSEWCATWLPPAVVDPSAVLRFRVTLLGGAVVHGDPFRIDGGSAGRPPCLKVGGSARD